MASSVRVGMDLKAPMAVPRWEDTESGVNGSTICHAVSAMCHRVSQQCGFSEPISRKFSSPDMESGRVLLQGDQAASETTCLSRLPGLVADRGLYA